jgi:hypothetical protein
MLANHGTGWYQSGALSYILSMGNNHFIDTGSSVGTVTATPLQ